jgi:copper chaperone CopZ
MRARRRFVPASYKASGLTCGHSVESVQAEIGRIAGVTDVRVELSGGDATVSSDQALDRETVRAAVDEAGHTLVR